MNTLTEKERQAVEAYARELSDKSGIDIHGDLYYGINKGAEFLSELRKEEAPSEEITFTKPKFIAKLKSIGFTKMDEANNYADGHGLNFVFEPNGRYSIANGRGDILCNSDDYNYALKCIELNRNLPEERTKLLIPDVNAELLAFAEWCSSNGWMLMNGESIFVPKGCWYDYDAWQDGEGVEQWYTTEELYEQFKNTQPK